MSLVSLACLAESLVVFQRISVFFSLSVYTPYLNTQTQTPGPFFFFKQHPAPAQCSGLVKLFAILKQKRKNKKNGEEKAPKPKRQTHAPTRTQLFSSCFSPPPCISASLLLLSDSDSVVGRMHRSNSSCLRLYFLESPCCKPAVMVIAEQ